MLLKFWLKDPLDNIEIKEPSNKDSSEPKLLLLIFKIGFIDLDPILIALPCLPSSVKSEYLDELYPPRLKRSNKGLVDLDNFLTLLSGYSLP